MFLSVPIGLGRITPLVNYMGIKVDVSNMGVKTLDQSFLKFQRMFKSIKALYTRSPTPNSGGLLIQFCFKVPQNWGI
jgi:hypothetical protein